MVHYACRETGQFGIGQPKEYPTQTKCPMETSDVFVCDATTGDSVSVTGAKTRLALKQAVYL